MSEPTEYKIKTLDDFLSVPVERIDACLADFANALRVHAAMSGVSGVARDRYRMTAFSWTDDGVQSVDVTIKVGSKTVLSVRSEPQS